MILLGSIGKMADAFDFVKAIQKGQNLFKESDDPEWLARDYVPFVTNKALSYSARTLFYAAEMNHYHRLPVRMQHDYLNSSIVPGRGTYTQWAKPDKSEDVLLVSEYYGYSLPKAREALKALTPDDLHTMRERMSKGGHEKGGKG